MRLIPSSRISLVGAALAVLGMVGCSSRVPHGFAPEDAGMEARAPSFGQGGPGPCVNLECQQVSCPVGQTTRVSGVVYAPALDGDPLYNAFVYVPNDTVEAFPAGVSCDRCNALASGHPVVTTLSDAHGYFALDNVPAGDNIPLVIQLGRWRKQLTLPHVAACAETALPSAMTHLPRNQQEGDIPHIAIATGAVDPLECVLLRVGLDPNEFTGPTGGGRVNYYVSNGAQMSPPAPDAGQLWNNATQLEQYDMVLLPCEGSPNYKPDAAVQNIIDYTSAGGRVFTTHYGYVWIYGAPPPFSAVADWAPESGALADPLPAVIDTHFPKGEAMAGWLHDFSSDDGYGQLAIGEPRHDMLAATPPSQAWITANPTWDFSGSPTVQELTFNTPVGAAVDQQCGRVVYSDFHVDAADPSVAGSGFPAECGTRGLTPQERVIEFMLFDLASCIQGDMQPPAPPPTK